MFRTTCSLLFLLAHIAGFSQNTRSKHFTDRALFGVHYGFEYDADGQNRDLYDLAQFWSPKAGISLARGLYAGVQARFIRASNFETPAQGFYMAGIWGRYYPVQAMLREKPGRWGVFVETGLMTGNYFYETKDFVTYPEERQGLWYIPAVGGAEFRVWKNLTIEGSVQLCFTTGENWNDHGIAYPSVGLDWHPEWR